MVDIQMPDFDTTPGNSLCLDFTHTLTERYSDIGPKELLNSYSDLVAWGLFAHILTDEEASTLLQVAEQHLERAKQALEQAKELREALYRLFYALAIEETPAKDDLDLLNMCLSEAMAQARIVPDTQGFKWDWVRDEQALDRILWPVVRSAADLLTSEKLPDVRACAAEDCRWLFLDISKNHSRRWCDMQTCGNQAKARRHYQRAKGRAVHS